MTKLTTVDPYMAHYVHEKEANPNASIVWKTYQKKMVDKVDRIVELAHGYRDTVNTLKDWEVVGELLKFFAEEWPHEFNSFKEQIPDIRSSRRADGYSSTREIKYVAALPPRFERMIKSIFPSQQFDKKFIYKLIRKFPVFKVGGVNNLSKGSIII
jgi:hypothetical protein